MQFFPAFISLTLAFASAIAGAFYGRQLRRVGIRPGNRLRLRDVPVIAALVAVLLGVVLPVLWIRNYPALFWHFPLSFQYYSGPLAWTFSVSFFCFVFFAIAVMYAPPQSWQGKGLLVFGICAAIFSEILIQESPFLQPIRVEAVRVVDGVVLQSTGATCAAAAAANIVRFYGEPKSEQEMIDLLGTTEFGTSTGQVFHGLSQSGFTCIRRTLEDGDFTQLHAPALLFVDFGSDPLGHVVCFMGEREGKAEIWNPQGGKTWQTREQLAASWHGHALEVYKER
ncbi:MAG: hypothetical protein HYV26_08995 [Candidatus Hydrogenedentes bacterium]|nr:hypothetical protein [Candidatus Hydrogenedentota bacterium]